MTRPPLNIPPSPPSGGSFRRAYVHGIATSSLSQTERATARAMAEFADWSSGGSCWPSVATLADWLGSHRSSVLRSLKALERRGWIQVERAPGRSSHYQLLLNQADMAPAKHLTETVLPVSGCYRYQAATGSTDVSNQSQAGVTVIPHQSHSATGVVSQCYRGGITVRHDLSEISQRSVTDQLTRASADASSELSEPEPSVSKPICAVGLVELSEPLTPEPQDLADALSSELRPTDDGAPTAAPTTTPAAAPTTTLTAPPTISAKHPNPRAEAQELDGLVVSLSAVIEAHRIDYGVRDLHLCLSPLLKRALNRGLSALDVEVEATLRIADAACAKLTSERARWAYMLRVLACSLAALPLSSEQPLGGDPGLMGAVWRDPVTGDVLSAATAGRAMHDASEPSAAPDSDCVAEAPDAQSESQGNDAALTQQAPLSFADAWASLHATMVDAANSFGARAIDLETNREIKG